MELQLTKTTAREAPLDAVPFVARPESAANAPEPANGSPPPATGSAPPQPSPSFLNSGAASPEFCHPPSAFCLFKRLPGETPRAFNAFIAWFQLGHSRSHQAVADKLGEGLPTIKNWASKYDWSERLLAFASGLLQQQAADAAEQQRKQAADWAARLDRFREQEWDAAQKLLAAAQCFLETFGDDHVQNMNLSQVSRALRISSHVARSALAGAELPPPSDAVMSPVQQQMLDAIRRLCSPSKPAASPAHIGPNPAP